MGISVRFLLDTNLVIEAVAGDKRGVAALHKAVESDWVGYSSITRLELFGYPDLTPDEESAISTILNELHEISVTPSVIDRAIMMRRKVRIKVPDAIIAATALDQNAVLLTRNASDFKSIDALEISNPWDK